MPNRILKESIKTCPQMDALSDFEFRVHTHLWVTSDKNGIYHGEPELLRAALFPLRPRLRLNDIDRCMTNLARTGLVQRWIGKDGRPYVRVLRFDQNTPKERPKFPLPPGEPDADGQAHLDGIETPPPPDHPAHRFRALEGNGSEMKETRPRRARRGPPGEYPSVLRKRLDQAEKDLDRLAYPGGCAHRVKLEGSKLDEAKLLTGLIEKTKTDLAEAEAWEAEQAS